MSESSNRGRISFRRGRAAEALASRSCWSRRRRLFWRSWSVNAARSGIEFVRSITTISIVDKTKTSAPVCQARKHRFGAGCPWKLGWAKVGRSTTASFTRGVVSMASESSRRRAPRAISPSGAHNCRRPALGLRNRTDRRAGSQGTRRAPPRNRQAMRRAQEEKLDLTRTLRRRRTSG
jgi:hypothetical protein